MYKNANEEESLKGLEDDNPQEASERMASGTNICYMFDCAIIIANQESQRE